MPEEEPQLEPNLPVQPNPAKPENEVAAPTEAEADVLDEDDDFEEFQNEGQLSPLVFANSPDFLKNIITDV